MAYILVHRVTPRLSQLNKTQVLGMTSETLPDLYFTDSIAGIQVNITPGFDGLAIKGIGSICTKEKADELLKMIQAAESL
jgi:hypothetical protein